MAKKLSTDFKFAIRTSPRIYDAIGALMRLGGTKGIKFNKRRLGAESTINAILFDFLEKPHTEQLEIVRRNVARFQAEMEKTPDESGLIGLTGQAALDAIAESQPTGEIPIPVDPPKPGRSGSTRKKA